MGQFRFERELLWSASSEMQFSYGCDTQAEVGGMEGGVAWRGEAGGTEIKGLPMR